MHHCHQDISEATEFGHNSRVLVLTSSLSEGALKMSDEAYPYRKKHILSSRRRQFIIDSGACFSCAGREEHNEQYHINS